MNSLCSMRGFLREVRVAMTARPDIPREAWVLAARHQHANYDAPGFAATAKGITALAVHYLVTQPRTTREAWLRAGNNPQQPRADHAQEVSVTPRATQARSTRRR